MLRQGRRRWRWWWWAPLAVGGGGRGEVMVWCCGGGVVAVAAVVAAASVPLTITSKRCTSKKPSSMIGLRCARIMRHGANLPSWVLILRMLYARTFEN